jgi:glycosyltransferase involved in cell wall biosynthesis
MKIVLVGSLAGHGPSRVLVSWARILARKRHDVLLIADSLGDLSKEIPASTHLEVCLTGSFARVPGLLRRVVHARAAASLYASRSDRFRADLIVTHFRPESLAMARRFPEAAHVATWHSPTFEEERLNLFTYGDRTKKLAFAALAWRYHSIDEAALRGIDAVHTLSRFTWDRLISRYPIPCRNKLWLQIPGTASESVTARNVSRSTARRILGLPRESLIFFAVRRLVPRNAPERIIEAAARVRAHGTRATFLIAGRGPLEARLRAKIEERKLSRSVRLLGFIPDSDLPLYYRAADASLMPTAQLECFGLPAIESLAHGTPCIATPCGGLPEILSPFPELLSERNSTTSFASAVLAFSRKHRTEDIDRRRFARYALTNYSEEAVAGRIEAGLEAAVHEAHVRRGI